MLFPLWCILQYKLLGEEGAPTTIDGMLLWNCIYMTMGRTEPLVAWILLTLARYLSEMLIRSYRGLTICHRVSGAVSTPRSYQISPALWSVTPALRSRYMMRRGVGTCCHHDHHQTSVSQHWLWPLTTAETLCHFRKYFVWIFHDKTGFFALHCWIRFG